MRTTSRIALSTIALFAALGSARAGDAGPHTVRSGVPTIVLNYALYHPETCYFGALPTIRVVAPPAHGAISVAKSTHEIPRGKCAGKVVRSTAVAYRSTGGFRGRDEAVVEVITDLHSEAIGRRSDTVRILVDVK